MGEIVHSESYLASPRSVWTPRFLREIEELGEEVGFVDAFHQILQNAHISVNVEGDVDRLKEHSGGILFIGDHKSRWEFIAIADVLSQMNRNELLNVAKFYVQRQAYRALGHLAATEHIVPVYPRILARDRPDIFNYEFFNRLKFHKHLLSFEESEAVNTESLTKAGQFLADNGTVNIHPTGCVKDATAHPWRPGIGRIIQYIPDTCKGDVLLAPYSVEEFSQARLLGAIATQGLSLFGAQTMEVKLGSLQSAEEFVDMLSDTERENPEAMTELLRQQFLDDFTNL